MGGGDDCDDCICTFVSWMRYTHSRIQCPVVPAMLDAVIDHNLCTYVYIARSSIVLWRHNKQAKRSHVLELQA